MLAIEEIRRIPGVKRHGCEPGERFELGARPLPTIAEQIVNTVRAGSTRIRSDRAGVPVHVALVVLPQDVEAALATAMEFLAQLRDDRTNPKDSHA